MNISIENITKVYDDKKILDIKEYFFKKGKITGVVGANGAGKSSLIRIIGGLEQPSQGIIFYEKEKDFKRVYREITLVFQHPYLLNTNVYHNIAYPLQQRKVNKKVIENRVDTFMKEMEIEGLRNQRANTLSGGEKQKVALARAVAFHPSLLLLDEPTANIDPNSTLIMERVIQKVNKTLGTTIIIVTHNLAQAKRICDEVIVMDNGRIIESGEVEEVMSYPQHIVTRNLINKESIC